MIHTISLFLGSFFFISNLFAQGPSAASSVDPCASDMAKLCKKLTGNDQIDCKWANYDSLSNACKGTIKEAYEKWPCNVDRSKFCKKSKDEDKEACVWEHYKSLSLRCKAEMDGLTKQWPCHMDASKYCRTIKKSDPNITVCLKENGKKLSADCKQMIGLKATPTKK